MTSLLHQVIYQKKLLLLSYSDIEKSEKIDTLEEDENPLDLHRFNSQKTMFLSNISASEELNIAGKVGKLPLAILNDDFCEKLDSPYIMP